MTVAVRGPPTGDPPRGAAQPRRRGGRPHRARLPRRAGSRGRGPLAPDRRAKRPGPGCRGPRPRGGHTDAKKGQRAYRRGE